MSRFFCAQALHLGQTLELPEGSAKHVQVMRMQPGQFLQLFDGRGGQFRAQITQMGKKNVQVHVLEHEAIEHENKRHVQLLVGMPANERMDWLVEKATELGVQRITPIMTQRSVLKLQGERASKKAQHWRSISIAACEQCTRNTLVEIDEPQSLALALRQYPVSPEHPSTQRFVLSTQSTLGDPHLTASTLQSIERVQILSGPEGGLDPSEERLLIEQEGFIPLSLGPRILRAETAALMGLVLLGQSLDPAT